MFKVSTGLRNYMLDSGSFRDAMNGCLLKIYGGPEPSSADDATGAQATLLVTISVEDSGDGLNFEAAAVNGVISKAAGEAWQGAVENSGIASFFRLELPNDSQSASLTALRAQGTVGQVAEDLNISNTTLIEYSLQVINHFNVALPSL